MAAREKSVIGAVGARILRFFSGDEDLRKRVEKSQGWKKWKLLRADLEEKYDEFSDLVEDRADRVEDFWEEGKYGEKLRGFWAKTVEETQELVEKIRRRAQQLDDAELRGWVDGVEEKLEDMVKHGGEELQKTAEKTKKSVSKKVAALVDDVEDARGQSEPEKTPKSSPKKSAATKTTAAKKSKNGAKSPAKSQKSGRSSSRKNEK